jgi:predicted nucleic acid-binding protein
VIADTSGIIAFLDKDDEYHLSAANVIKNYSFYIPVTVLPEVDYLATKYLGERVSRAFLQDLSDGYFKYISIDVQDIIKATAIMEKYKDLPGTSNFCNDRRGINSPPHSPSPLKRTSAMRP